MTKLNNLCVMASYKSGWIFLLWVALLGGCQQKQKQQEEYSYLIVVDVEGCESCQAKLYLLDFTAFKEIDSTKNGSGHFSFKGKITQPGLYDIFYYSKADVTVSGSVQVYLPTDSIHVKITKNNIRTKFGRVLNV